MTVAALRAARDLASQLHLQMAMQILIAHHAVVDGDKKERKKLWLFSNHHRGLRRQQPGAGDKYLPSAAGFDQTLVATYIPKTTVPSVRATCDAPDVA